MIDETDSKDILNWFKASDFDKLEYLADIKHIVNNDDLTADQKIKSIKMINEKAPKTEYDNPTYTLVRNDYAYNEIQKQANNSNTILDRLLLDTIGHYVANITEISYNIENKADIDYLKQLLNRQMYQVWLTHQATLDDVLGLTSMPVYTIGSVKLIPNTEDCLIINGQMVTFDELKSGKFADKIRILKKVVN